MSKQKRLDYIGEKYGRLTVTGLLDDDGKVPCKCDCGRETKVSVSSLRAGRTKSCGCLKKEESRKTIWKAIQKDKVLGTSLGQLIAKKAYSTNTSGHRGVYQKGNKFLAFICLRRKQYHLGSFDTLNEAIAARKEAEERMYKPIIEMAIDQGLYA